MLEDIIPRQGPDQEPDVLIALVPNECLLLPGGAYLSRPLWMPWGEKWAFQDQTAGDNLTYRHVTMLVSPFSAIMIYLPSLLQGQSIYAVIGLNIPFMLVMALMAAWLYLPRGKHRTQGAQGQSRARLAVSLIKGLSPILLVLLINACCSCP